MPPEPVIWPEREVRPLEPGVVSPNNWTFLLSVSVPFQRLKLVLPVLVPPMLTSPVPRLATVMALAMVVFPELFATRAMLLVPVLPSPSTMEPLPKEVDAPPMSVPWLTNEPPA